MVMIVVLLVDVICCGHDCIIHDVCRNHFPANVSDKIPEGAIPRYLEDEGFYVGKPTPISIANLNIMENRLLGKVKEVIET